MYPGAWGRMLAVPSKKVLMRKGNKTPSAASNKKREEGYHQEFLKQVPRHTLHLTSKMWVSSGKEAGNIFIET